MTSELFWLSKKLNKVGIVSTVKKHVSFQNKQISKFERKQRDLSLTEQTESVFTREQKCPI